MSDKKDKRKQLRPEREHLAKMLYMMSMRKDFSQEMLDDYKMEFAEDQEAFDYFDSAANAVMQHRFEIDDRISASSSNWSINRISEMDLAILRMGAAEIMFMDKMNKANAINEAVELAKKYGTEKSAKFINAVLDRIRRDIAAANTEEPAGEASENE